MAKLTASEIAVLCTIRCDYNSANKAEFRRLGMKLARDLARELGLAPGSFNVHFNPGGVAVSGDVSLHHERFHLFFSRSLDWICARTCEGRKDFTGGPNCSFTYERLQREGFDGLVAWMQRLFGGRLQEAS